MSIPVANFFLPADFSDFSVPVDRSHAQCNGVLEAWKMKPVLGHPSFLHIPHTSVYTRYIFLLTFWGLSLHTTIHPIIHRLINESINQSIMNLSITSHKPLVLSHLGSGSCATRRTQRLTQWFHAMKIKYVCDEYNTNIYIYIYTCIYVPVRVRVRVYVCIRTYHIQPALEHQPARMVHTWVLRGRRGPWNHIVWIGSFTTDQLPGKGTSIRDLASAPGAYWNVSLGSETPVDELVILGGLNPKKLLTYIMTWKIPQTIQGLMNPGMGWDLKLSTKLLGKNSVLAD